MTPLHAPGVIVCGRVRVLVREEGGEKGPAFAFVEETKLQPATVELRAKLRAQLESRFPFTGAGTAVKEAATRYGTAAFLDPRYRRLADLNVSDTFVSETMKDVRVRMTNTLAPLYTTLNAAYLASMNHERSAETRTEVQAGPKRQRVEPSGALGFMDIIRLQRQRAEGSAGGDAEPSAGRGAHAEAADDTPTVSSPDEVVKRIIETELGVYRQLSAVSETTDVLQWWRRNITLLPVLSLVAASVLVIPASSCEFAHHTNLTC
jgi:hAT family C-terminal dimerisation region